MRITTTVFLLSLAILFLGTSLADASQQAQLRKFMESRVTKRLGKTYTTNQLAEGTDLWADPASSFGHLPERCNIAASGSKESDKIAALPGQPTSVNFDQYAGNVKVDEEHDRELFYYFAESPYDAASKPLLLWLNGGKKDRVMHHHAWRTAVAVKDDWTRSCLTCSWTCVQGQDVHRLDTVRWRNSARSA
jgi:serine carboxypeptidase-like clade II